MNLSILDEIPPGLFDRYLGPSVGHAAAGEMEGQGQWDRAR
jgi:hypothetical protein